MDNADEIRRALVELARDRHETVLRYIDVRDELRSHRNELARLIPAAREAGLTMVEIARLAGVTRQTVYDLLK